MYHGHHLHQHDGYPSASQNPGTCRHGLWHGVACPHCEHELSILLQQAMITPSPLPVFPTLQPGAPPPSVTSARYPPLPSAGMGHNHSMLPTALDSVTPSPISPLAESRRPAWDSTHSVRRPQVGSPQVTEMALPRRKKMPTFFCRVPDCKSQGFTEKHNLNYHMRSHRDDRPYECDKCGRGFRSSSDLNRHRTKSKIPCDERESRTSRAYDSERQY